MGALQSSTSRSRITMLFGFLALAVAGIGIACADGINNPGQARSTETLYRVAHNRKASPGEIHNKGLDFAYARIMKAVNAKKDRRLSPTELVEVAQTACNDFFAQEHFTTSCVDIKSYVLRKGRMSLREKTEEPAMIARSHLANISEAGANYMNQMSAASYYSGSAAALDAAVASIVSAANGNLSPEEADAVATAASIGVSSAYYWEANQPAWDAIPLGGQALAVRASGRAGLRETSDQEHVPPDAFSRVPYAPTNWFNWRNVANTDFAVGIATACFAPHAAIEAGLGASMADAILQVLNHVIQ